jgi:serine/threonine protein phosphatase PrpC
LIEVAHAVLAVSGTGQERVAVVRTGEAVTLVVADGSGGLSGGLGGGAAAADQAVRIASEGRAPWTEVIARIDAIPAAGQCALVIAHVAGTRITGASVGDCSAWLIGDDDDDLTEWQKYKPLVGSGLAEPVAFEAELKRGATLLLGSDGLFHYAREGEILACARGVDLQATADALANLPRLRPGRLVDDVSVVLCRMT